MPLATTNSASNSKSFFYDFTVFVCTVFISIYVWRTDYGGDCSLQCRKTKSKCEVSDDLSACVKCKREHRKCVFVSRRSPRQGCRKHDGLLLGSSQQEHSSYTDLNESHSNPPTDPDCASHETTNPAAVSGSVSSYPSC